MRTKAFAWIAAARAKKPDASYIRLSAEDSSEKSLQEVTQSQGLFYSKMLVLLDDPFALTDSGEIVLAMLEQLAETNNPIAILAPKLTAPRVKKIEAVAHKVFVIHEEQAAVIQECTRMNIRIKPALYAELPGIAHAQIGHVIINIAA